MKARNKRLKDLHGVGLLTVCIIRNIITLFEVCMKFFLLVCSSVCKLLLLSDQSNCFRGVSKGQVQRRVQSKGLTSSFSLLYCADSGNAEHQNDVLLQTAD